MIRYVDLMENSIAQSLHRAFEKEKWAAVSPSGPLTATVGGTGGGASGVSPAAGQTAGGGGGTTGAGSGGSLSATAAAYHCACTEQLYWKLGALQQFVQRLHWPGEDIAKHLQQRLRQMACEMLQAALTRTMCAFADCKRRHTLTGVSARFASPTEFILPVEMCAQINAVLETRNQSLRLCLFDGVDTVSFPWKGLACWV